MIVIRHHHEAQAVRPRFAMIAWLGALALGGCQLTPRPKPVVAGPVLPLPPSVTPAAPQRARVGTAWRFVADPVAGCVARADGRGGRLRVTVRRGHGVTFVLYVPGALRRTGRHWAGAMRFAGRGGGWVVPARLGPGGLAVGYSPLDAAAIGRIALLLGGGRLDVIGGGALLPMLDLPASGAAGRAWYGCARGTLF